MNYISLFSRQFNQIFMFLAFSKMLIKGLRQFQRHFAALPAYQNFRKASAAAATKEAEPEPQEPGQGIPLEEGPSTSVPSSGERLLSPRVQQLIDQIAGLSLLEVADLNYGLKKRLNIADTPMMPAGAMMAAAAVASAASAAAEQVQQQPEEIAPTKTSYAVKLNKFDDAKKIALIKEIRNNVPNMNLVQAKKFIESAPVEVKGDLGMNEAEELKAKLEAVGAECEVV